MNISTSPLLDASREESCLNTDTVEEVEEPTLLQPPPSAPPPSKPSLSSPFILKKPVSKDAKWQPYICEEEVMDGCTDIVYVDLSRM